MCLFKESLFNKPFLLAVKITFAFLIATLSKLFQRCCCCYLVNKVDLRALAFLKPVSAG